MQIISGMLLMIMGVFLVTNFIFVLSTWAQRAGFYMVIQMPNSATPSYAVAVLGGLVSLLSLCVLAMVPAFVGNLGKRVAEST